MKSPTNLKAVKFELKGLDEYLKKVEAAGKNVEEACKKAIGESGKPVFDDIKAWAEKHKESGDTLKGVSISPVKQDGNYIYTEIGIDTTDAKNAWHAVFVEYGSPHNAADPGIRRSYSDNKSKVKKIQKDILIQEGMPID